MLSVVGILATWFYQLAIKPLKEAIYALKEQMRDLAHEIQISRNDRRAFDARLTRVEESVKVSHKRIDTLEERCVAHTRHGV